MSEAPVLFELLSSGNGKSVAVITLNMEASLNSLSLTMTDMIQTKLNDWEHDDNVACVFLHSTGEKAFCAGGDIRQLYNSIIESGNNHNQYAIDFWSREYQLDYHIHTYNKPIIVWAAGFVMGGGIGLVIGCSHRVVTENSRMAMPEVGIGLYPDVGGTWFLQRAPGRTGLFAAMTGVTINATDALFMRMADRFISADKRLTLINELKSIAWQSDSRSNSAQISQLLRAFELASTALKPAPNVLPNFETIENLTDHDDLAAMVNAISHYNEGDPWMTKAAKGITNGCPASIALAYEQYQRGKHLSLKQAFQLELILSLSCARYNNFKEGVRALMIDKDRNPNFIPATIDELNQDFIEQHFQAPWPEGEHPLKDL